MCLAVFAQAIVLPALDHAPEVETIVTGGRFRDDKLDYFQALARSQVLKSGGGAAF